MTDVFAFKGYELPVPLVNMTGGGPDSFASISEAHIAELHRYIGIASGSRVLEVGCGIGRDAIPLTEIITEGDYDGIDIIAPSIAWLNAHVAVEHPRFRFHHLDVSDQLHNPDGALAMQSLSLPLADDSKDCAFGWSVFTHMWADDIRHYLSEVRRILRPSGRAFFTCFMLSEQVIAKSQTTNPLPSPLSFGHQIERDCWVSVPDYPLGAIGYGRERLEQMVDGAGLRLERLALGTWSGYWAEGETGQDGLVMVKP